MLKRLQKHSEKEDDDGSENASFLNEISESDDTSDSERSEDDSEDENDEGKDDSSKEEVAKEDEYVNDSSDEEDVINTVGNIPMQWYKDFEHIGYDVSGKKLLKPKSGDELDEFLDKMDNPDYWRTVHDKSTGKKVVLSESDVAMIKNFMKGKFVETTMDPYEPSVDFFTGETMVHPVTNRPEHKRSFVPSNWERLKVGQLVHAMKMGWVKISQAKKDEEENDDEKLPNFYELWTCDSQSEMNRKYRQFIPAPKMALPGHAESYNPPPEYLFTPEEEKEWNEKEPGERRMNFIPKKYSSLREVPAYPRFVNERFERCLDLYLCPRQMKMRAHVKPEDLLPKLPKPRDLQPFPTAQAIIYRGHAGAVRTISVDPTGLWLVSGSEDRSIKFWEVSTGRCLKTLKTTGSVKDIAWNPNNSISLVAAIVDNHVLIINTQLGNRVKATEDFISSFVAENSETPKISVSWHSPYSDSEKSDGICLKISHPKSVDQIVWHKKGDFFSTVMKEGQSMSVLLHQLSKRKSQNPFRKAKGLVQCVQFHPSKPIFFVASQRYVRQYDLTKQELTKKLMTNCKWVSSLAVHPAGDNVIIGSYDKRLSWFDLALSDKPYKTLRHHHKAIRQVCFHKSLPLFASASDDGTIIVCHGMVYNDFNMDPLICPLKILKGHTITGGLGILDSEFHPTEPWIFSAGADHTIRLYS